MSDNEMIAQFMGMQKNKYNEWEGGWFLPEYVLCNEGHKKQFAVQDLAFDRSWDWLIPVVDECFDVAEDGDMVEIMHHLQVAVKDEVYREVIQFIDYYNAREFPFKEGDDYWAIEDDGTLSTLSCWDDQSEIMHLQNPDRKYFSSEKEGLEYIKSQKS